MDRLCGCEAGDRQTVQQAERRYDEEGEVGGEVVKKWRAQRAKRAKQNGLVSGGVALGGFAPKTH